MCVCRSYAFTVKSEREFMHGLSHRVVKSASYCRHDWLLLINVRHVTYTKVECTQRPIIQDELTYLVASEAETTIVGTYMISIPQT